MFVEEKSLGVVMQMDSVIVGGFDDKTGMLRTRDHFRCPLWMIKRDTDPKTREIEGYFSPLLRNVSDSDPIEALNCVSLRRRGVCLVQQEDFGENFHRKH
jgi:hypothetical protein